MPRAGRRAPTTASASSAPARPIPPQQACPPWWPSRRRHRPAPVPRPAARSSGRPHSRASRAREAPPRPAAGGRDRSVRRCAPSSSAVMPAARPATVRNWPAAAVDTCRSCAACASTGDIAISAAWPANRLVKRATLTARYPWPMPFVVLVNSSSGLVVFSQQTRRAELRGWRRGKAAVKGDAHGRRRRREPARTAVTASLPARHRDRPRPRWPATVRQACGRRAGPRGHHTEVIRDGLDTGASARDRRHFREAPLQ